MVDCSLFQSLKPLQNWEPLPIDPKSLDGVVLTHAHLDHSGYLPLLSKNGFRGPIRCTQSTADLCRILLPDSGYLQERDAEFAKQHGYSKHNPALPLYSEADARATLELFRSIPFTLMHTLHAGVAITFRRTGHILGAASVKFGIDDLKIMRWCRGFDHPPKMTFVTHGEPEPASALRHRLERELAWHCIVPVHMQTFELS